MLVKYNTDGVLTISTTDDLPYFLKCLPGQVDGYKAQKPASTQMMVSVVLNGSTPRVQHSDDGDFKIETVMKQLGLRRGQFRPKNMSKGRLYMEITIERTYELGECTSDGVLKDINECLKGLTDAGFDNKATKPATDEGEDD